MEVLDRRTQSPSKSSPIQSPGSFQINNSSIPIRTPPPLIAKFSFDESVSTLLPGITSKSLVVQPEDRVRQILGIILEKIDPSESKKITVEDFILGIEQDGYYVPLDLEDCLSEKLLDLKQQSGYRLVVKKNNQTNNNSVQLVLSESLAKKTQCTSIRVPVKIGQTVEEIRYLVYKKLRLPDPIENYGLYSMDKQLENNELISYYIPFKIIFAAIKDYYFQSQEGDPERLSSSTTAATTTESNTSGRSSRPIPIRKSIITRSLTPTPVKINLCPELSKELCCLSKTVTVQPHQTVNEVIVMVYERLRKCVSNSNQIEIAGSHQFALLVEKGSLLLSRKDKLLEVLSNIDQVEPTLVLIRFARGSE